MARPDRLLIVSNRLPIAIRLEEGHVRLVNASGGLATGLRGCHEQSDGAWLGWPGDMSRLTPPQVRDLGQRLQAQRIVPVELSMAEVRRYYEEFSNGVLWPLFHYLLDRIPVGANGWTTYQQVNAKFADAIVRHYQPGTMIWVHDYQLMLVPRLVRERLPDARIGFFLHIPFPSPDVFRILPWREDIMRGLLGADLIGFHTFSYQRHFADALLQLLGLECSVDRTVVDGREVRLGVFPMGVDVGAFERLAADPGAQAEAEAIRAEAGGRQILLGVDRLDYTKGIPRRLLAIERLLEAGPAWRDHLRFIQLAVPSRTKIEMYKGFRREVEETVGRINGTYGTVGSVPIHYLYRSVSPRRLVAMYRAADVMVVTPVRDGMNLVAKEFVASRTDGDGVLVLSELAGAAAELGEALLVNPYDVDGMAATLEHALTMDAAERSTRMRNLRGRVVAQDIHRWTASFLEALREIAPVAPARTLRPTSPEGVEALAERLRHATHLVLLLDYDGALVRRPNAPGLAPPDQALMQLLARLAARPATAVHLMSGRRRETLEGWFGRLPVGLWAEHGLWFRPGLGGPWRCLEEVSSEWVARVRPMLEQYTRSTPGSLIEERSASIAWHHGMADPESGSIQARGLRAALGQAVANLPVEIVEDGRAIELRPYGIHRGRIVERILAAAPPPATMVAAGSARVDEEAFCVLPASGVAIHVGAGASKAAYRLADHVAMRALLRRLLGDAGEP
ncbi:MAG TPA: bifunctional alpha,alpha-trehalose-phosphate synthase (UDP-forming)/trehalose-phosphatase [Vicinamibacterales bacterium]|nr:bifunctional alpha,alpha-trehalose-phosphate synthase (UDP-forming)/trehalose-phosphatase [Vicinamibacterales bacterium]